MELKSFFPRLSLSTQHLPLYLKGFNSMIGELQVSELSFLGKYGRHISKERVSAPNDSGRWAHITISQLATTRYPLLRGKAGLALERC